MSELPKGWVGTTIGTLIFNMVGGASPKKENYSISGTLALNKGDIKENGIIKIKDQANYLPQEFVDKHVSKKVSTGAILVTLRDLSQKADFLGLISTYRGSNEALITQGMYALNTSEFIIDDLVVLYSNTIFYRLYVKQEKIGATQVHLRNEQFLNIPFPLAPIAEQKRIVEKLDQVLAQVDTIKARLDGIPAILKRFRQSVLAAAVSGKLTEEWRGDSSYNSNDYPKNWKLRGLSDVGVLARGKSKQRPRNDIRLFGSEYPFIQTGEVANSNGEITSATKFYSEFGLAQSRLFPSGTLCITIAANIADTAILNINACFPDSVVGFTPELSKCDVLFVKYLIDVNKDNLEAFAPATAQKNINLKVL